MSKETLRRSRRDQGAAVDADGMQPGACAVERAAGVGAFVVEDAEKERGGEGEMAVRSRSVQSAGAASQVPKTASARETPSHHNTNTGCGERSREDAGGASGGERTDAALPAAQSAEITVRRSDGERCDRVGPTPGGKMVQTDGGRLMHIAASFIELHARRACREVRMVKMDRGFARACTGHRAARVKRLVLEGIGAARVDCMLADEYTAQALGEFLFHESRQLTASDLASGLGAPAAVRVPAQQHPTGDDGAALKGGLA